MTTENPRRLLPADLDALVLGATLLGSGGGGVAALYLHQLRDALPQDGVELVPLTEAAARGLRVVAPVGMIGATSVLTEKLPSGHEIPDAVAAAERWTGKHIDALMPVEAAGVNATLPVAAAGDLGLPLIDADLMGRAFPRFDQLSIVAVQPSVVLPAVLAQPGGQLLVVDGSSPPELERAVRSYVANAGGWAGAAFGPLVIADLAGRACEGTLGRAIRLGSALLNAHRDTDPQALAGALGGTALVAGRVIDVARAATAGFTRTSFAIADRGGPVLRIEAENEYLVAILDGEVLVTCPDLICVLDRRLAEPVAVEELRLGDDVQVIALPGPRWWFDHPDLIDVVGPRAFAIDIDPVPLVVPC